MSEEKIKKSGDAKAEKWEEILSDTEVTDGACESKKDKKKEEKQLKDENKRLTAELEKMKSELEKVKSEYAEINDKYLRVAAEYDNFRKRSAKEREGIYAEAYADALSSILPIMDNLERAAIYTDGEQLADGLKLIFKSAKDAFERIGVIEFGAAGEQFDPQIHNAMMHIEDEALGANEIVEVFQKGYKKGDRVLREALVKVAN